MDADVPSCPRNLSVVEYNKDSVDLSWQCPETDGGSPIVQYVIEKCDVTRAAGAGGAMWTECGITTKLSAHVRKLQEGNSYLFRVCAENNAGRGPPTELSEPVIARLPYGTLAQCFNNC